MLNRRHVIVSTAAAATAAAVNPQLAAAATDALVDVRVDPWNPSPELLAKRAQPLPKYDDESRQDFTRGISRFLQRDGGRAEAKAATAAFITSKGASLTEPTHLSRQESFNFMLQDPVYAARTRLNRSNFYIHWDNPKRAFYRDYDKYMAAMEATDRAGPGSLELNPEMFIPEYAKYEIHAQPGGYVGDPFAGWIYDYGHTAGTDELKDGSRAVAYAQNIQVPADGKVRRVLDIGCSMGISTSAIKERFPNAEVWGIDVGGPMVRYAHHRAVNHGLDIHFAQRLAEDSKFPDGYFDIVADCLVFHEVTPAAAKKILAEIHRILRPGGVFSHTDTATEGQVGYKAPETLLDKASMHVNNYVNFETWREQFLATNFPAVVRQAGFHVDQSGPGVKNSKNGSGTFPPLFATKMA